MDVDIPIDLLQAYSRAELTRREIEARVGHGVSFGTLLGQLHQHHLPLPRIPSDPNARGIQLVRALVAQGRPHAS